MLFLYEFCPLQERGIVRGQGRLKDIREKMDRAKNEPVILTVKKQNKTRNLVTLSQNRQRHHKYQQKQIIMGVQRRN